MNNQNTCNIKEWRHVREEQDRAFAESLELDQWKRAEKERREEVEEGYNFHAFVICTCACLEWISKVLGL